MLQRIGQIDTSAVLWFVVRRRPALNSIMKGATRIGDGYVWAIFAGLLWILAPSDHRIVLQLAAAFAIELSIYTVVKARFSRPRPFVMLPDITRLVVPPDEFSFPSGHTAAAFVMAVVLGLHSVAVGLLLLPVAMTIGISRVYLGVHYPTDIVAGALLGAASGVAGWLLF